MNPTNTIAKGAGFFLIGLFFSRLLSYIYRLILARLGPEDYGLLSLGISIISLIVMLCLVWLESGVERYVAYFDSKGDKERVKGVLVFSLFLSLILSLIFIPLLFILSENVAGMFSSNKNLVTVLRIFSITIPFYCLSRIGLAALRAIRKVKYEVYARNLFENILKIILTFIFVYILNLNLSGAFFAFLLSIILTSGLVAFFLYTNLLKSLKCKSVFIIPELFSYSWPLLLSNLIGSLMIWTDTLMIGLISKNASLVGIYNIALPTAGLVLIVPISIHAIFKPVTAYMVAKANKKEINEIYKTATRWAFLLNYPFVILLVLFAKEFILLLFGEVYIEAVVPLKILAVSYLISSTFAISKSILEVFKKTRLILFNTFVTTILNIFLNYLLIYRFGINGAAIATGISLILFGLFCLVETRSRLNFQIRNVNFLKIILIGIVPIPILMVFKEIFSETPLITFFLSTIYGLLYLTLIISFGVKRVDLDLIKSGIKKLKRF